MTYISDELKEKMGYILIQNPSRETYEILRKEAERANKHNVDETKHMKISHAYNSYMVCMTENMVEDVEYSVRELMKTYEESLANFVWKDLSTNQQTALIKTCANSYDWLCGGGRFEDDSEVEAIKEILQWE